MTYKDLGYSKLLIKEANSPNGNTEMTEDVSSQIIPSLSGTSINGGLTTSNDGKMKIDWDKAQILISDGAYDRIFIGLTNE